MSNFTKIKLIGGDTKESANVFQIYFTDGTVGSTANIEGAKYRDEILEFSGEILLDRVIVEYRESDGAVLAYHFDEPELNNPFILISKEIYYKVCQKSMQVVDGVVQEFKEKPSNILKATVKSALSEIQTICDNLVYLFVDCNNSPEQLLRYKVKAETALKILQGTATENEISGLALEASIDGMNVQQLAQIVVGRNSFLINQINPLIETVRRAMNFKIAEISKLPKEALNSTSEDGASTVKSVIIAKALEDFKTLVNEGSELIITNPLGLSMSELYGEYLNKFKTALVANKTNAEPVAPIPVPEVEPTPEEAPIEESNLGETVMTGDTPPIIPEEISDQPITPVETIEETPTEPTPSEPITEEPIIEEPINTPA